MDASSEIVLTRKKSEVFRFFKGFFFFESECSHYWYAENKERRKDENEDRCEIDGFYL